MLAFGGGHFEAALNISGTALMPIWAGWSLDSDASLREVVTYLLRTGFTRFAGYLVGGTMTAWDNTALQTVPTMQRTVDEIYRDRVEMTLADVRSPDEFKAGHTSGAVRLFLPTLLQHLEEIPADRPIAVYCGTGYRASLGASMLQKAGLNDVANIPSSFRASQRADYEVGS